MTTFVQRFSARFSIQPKRCSTRQERRHTSNTSATSNASSARARPGRSEVLFERFISEGLVDMPAPVATAHRRLHEGVPACPERAIPGGRDD